MVADDSPCAPACNRDRCADRYCRSPLPPMTALQIPWGKYPSRRETSRHAQRYTSTMRTCFDVGSNRASTPTCGPAHRDEGTRIRKPLPETTTGSTDDVKCGQARDQRRADTSSTAPDRQPRAPARPPCSADHTRGVERYATLRLCASQLPPPCDRLDPTKPDDIVQTHPDPHRKRQCIPAASTDYGRPRQALAARRYWNALCRRARFRCVDPSARFWPWLPMPPPRTHAVSFSATFLRLAETKRGRRNIRALVGVPQEVRTRRAWIIASSSPERPSHTQPSPRVPITGRARLRCSPGTRTISLVPACTGRQPLTPNPADSGDPFLRAFARLVERYYIGTHKNKNPAVLKLGFVSHTHAPRVVIDELPPKTTPAFQTQSLLHGNRSVHGQRFSESVLCCSEIPDTNGRSRNRVCCRCAGAAASATRRITPAGRVLQIARNPGPTRGNVRLHADCETMGSPLLEPSARSPGQRTQSVPAFHKLPGLAPTRMMPLTIRRPPPPVPSRAAASGPAQMSELLRSRRYLKPIQISQHYHGHPSVNVR